MRRITRHATTAALAAALLLTAGCGGDGDDDRKATTADPGGREPAGGTSTKATTGSGAAGTDQADRQALESAVRKYTVALFADDPGTAYAILSARCQKKISKTEYTSLTAQAKQTYGALTIKNLSIDQLSGDLARVTYGVGVPALERTAQPWSREAGTWRWDAC
ncbi:hypothetical protein OG948_21320 [Embleya sp. NBC_00888]|uniref:hypothetical protein n=1 Tax=Embleya sp. NBC_00888 TaxID=2975960 RepID=UPI00386E83CE|nr:hypothetical protein OG948_21320 [Embleya sp. NBC_00888]